ncbi:hypothetical protein HQ576_16345, partial [bacterium]|nr:hypothetical protein [bacterium]
MAVDGKLAEEIRRRTPLRGAHMRRLPCAVAFEIAEALGVPVATVGQAANELAIKVVDC